MSEYRIKEDGSEEILLTATQTGTLGDGRKVGSADVHVKGSSVLRSVEASFTRPNNTTAYTAGDVVGTDPAANMLFAGVVGTAGASAFAVGARVRVDATSIPSGQAGFRIHLYDAAPTAIIDNAAYNLPSGDRGKYLGYINAVVGRDLGETVWYQDEGQNVPITTASTTVYGILETIGAYTPGAETVKTVTLYFLEA